MPGRTLSAAPRTKSRPAPSPTKVPVAIRSSSPCRSSATPPSSDPVLILGPDKSCRIATSRPARAAAARTRATVAPCVSWVPCEKFRRMMSVPAAMSVSSTASESLAGPTVAMIFVCHVESESIMVRHDTSVARWLHLAVTDAEARGLPELKGLLEASRVHSALRAAELGVPWSFVRRPFTDSRRLPSPKATNVSSRRPGRGDADDR
jgi:hypothetical protein